MFPFLGALVFMAQRLCRHENTSSHHLRQKLLDRLASRHQRAGFPEAIVRWWQAGAWLRNWFNCLVVEEICGKFKHHISVWLMVSR